MRGWFITGTDTGVGKTALAAALLAALRRAGRDAAPAKPVQTGCPRGHPAPDLDFVLRAAGLAVPREEYAWMAPYRFEPPCSPHLAARRAGVRISLSVIERSLRRLAARHELLLVEGAGGVMVPLNPAHTMRDLMARLGLPVLVAARPGLGTINHTLLTLESLRGAGLRVAAVVLVQGRPGRRTYIDQDNEITLARRGRTPVRRLSYDRGLAAGRPGRSVDEAAGLLALLNGRCG